MCVSIKGIKFSGKKNTANLRVTLQHSSMNFGKQINYWCLEYNKRRLNPKFPELREEVQEIYYFYCFTHLCFTHTSLQPTIHPSFTPQAVLWPSSLFTPQPHSGAIQLTIKYSIKMLPCWFISFC